jgi:hypothetical protein
MQARMANRRSDPCASFGVSTSGELGGHVQDDGGVLAAYHGNCGKRCIDEEVGGSN